MITETTPKDILQKELAELEAKWNIDIKSKYNAGGNSKDNQRMIEIRILLR